MIMIDRNTIHATLSSFGVSLKYPEADELVTTLAALFEPQPAPAPEFHHVYRECGVNYLTRTLDDLKPEETVIAIISGPYGDGTWRDPVKGYVRHDGYRIVIRTTACNHQWREGWGFGAPTRTCTKCGKFEND
jgi:hypothetical protein